MEIAILQAQALQDWSETIGMPGEAAQALQTVRAAVTADPALQAIFEDFYRRTSLQGEWDRGWQQLEPHPLVAERFGPAYSLFYLLAYMAAIPALEQIYRQRGIDRLIFLATLADIPFYTQKYQVVHGYWGFDEFRWIWRHLICELFRLGRMQYMLKPFPDDVTALQRRADGEIVLLADPNRILRADGYALGAGEKAAPVGSGAAPAGSGAVPVDGGAVSVDGGSVPVGSGEDESWNAVFEERAEGWYGHPISAYGCVQRAPLLFPRSAWQCVLQQGDLVLDLHIPEGTSLTEAECRDSYQQAHAFFGRHFPDRPFKGLFCHTWLFSPQLQSLLPIHSSIVRFQRAFYLYPYPGSVEFLWNFVFGQRYPDAASAPRDTSLRRAVLDWLAAGKPIFDLPGVLFYPPQDWGSQPYMTHEDQRSAHVA